MKKLFRFLISKIFWGILIHFVDDVWYAKIRYWLVMDRWGDFKNPTLFTEKIQFIKLYERTEIRRLVADRLKARDYVSEKAGKEHLIPLYSTFETLSRNDWENLPQQFVLKANHGCGMVEIIQDKSVKSFEEIRALTKQWQDIDYYNVGHEWVYKGLPRSILAEKLILNSDGEIPRDWKFFCFHGEVKIIQEDLWRFGEQDHARNLYNRDFEKIEAKLLYPPRPDVRDKPPLLDKAIEIAELLSVDFNFIRVDLYITKNRVYFGELTNYPGNGFIPFEPESMEYAVGKMLDLDIRAAKSN